MTNQLHWGLQNITRITIGINITFSHKSHHFGFMRQTTFIAIKILVTKVPEKLTQSNKKLNIGCVKMEINIPTNI